MISPELEAKILQLHHAERWPPGTIADQLGIHHSVVLRVLERDGVPEATHTRRSKADPFIPFILKTLKTYPRLSAARLYQMACERGYEGRPSQFRAIVARYRPSRPAEAYLRLKTLQGDQAQVDWGNFGKLKVGEAKRPLVGFVMVLSYSRAIFLRFFPSQQFAHLLAGRGLGDEGDASHNAARVDATWSPTRRPSPDAEREAQVYSSERAGTPRT